MFEFDASTATQSEMDANWHGYTDGLHKKPKESVKYQGQDRVAYHAGYNYGVTIGEPMREGR